MKLIMVYKAHDKPVFDVTWGPFGHYFLSGGHDKRACLWTTARPGAVRVFNHDQCVDCVAFHPNGAYAFTASSDRTVRMFSCTNGNSVRLFTGHTGDITSLACSPTGKVLASADDHGVIILWDLAGGKMIKRMRGHDRGGIWSLSWNVEGTLLMSGGADCTLRSWDTEKVEPMGQGRIVGDMGARVDGQGGTAPATVGATAAGSAGTGKKKGKGPSVSGDQVSAFPTKATPVSFVMFTRMNLGLAAGCYSGNQG